MPPREIGSTICLAEKLPADAVLERSLRDARLAEQALVEVERKFVALAKSRVGGDALEDLLVGDPEMEVIGFLFDQALAQQLLQQVEAHLGIVEERRIDVLLRVTPQHVLLVADRTRELLLADVAAVEFRDFTGAVGALEVIVDAEEGERHHDEREDELRDALVFVNDVVHQLPIISWVRESPCHANGRRASQLPPERPARAAGCEKGELAFALRIGGVDGTRTRDPRRDRPVF